MCMCGKPTINGEPGYSWDGKTFTIRQPDPPEMMEGDILLMDEPGRCGGLDCHSHHFRLVQTRYRRALLVRHGGGDERILLGSTADLFLKSLPSLGSLGSNARFWLLHTLYSTHREAEESAKANEAARWRKAAAEKRIKVQKVRNQNMARVSIEPPRQVAVTH